MALYHVLTQPDKFEGELSIVPSLWELATSGYATDVILNDGTYSFIETAAVSESEADEHELYGAVLWLDDQGFVRSQWFATAQAYAEALAEMKATETNEAAA